jgi:hypothetical protein
MFDNFKMGLKPLVHQYIINPFTKVNSLPRIVGGNLNIISNFAGFLLPSALADGLYKLLLYQALATFGDESAKCLNQKVK